MSRLQLFSGSDWVHDDLEDLMTQALLDQRLEFVDLFLHNGLIMQNYLTVNKLRYLYNSEVINL